VFPLLTQKRVLRVTTSRAARPSAGVLSLDFVPTPAFVEVCIMYAKDIMLRGGKIDVSPLVLALRIFSGIFRCCSNKCNPQS